MSICEKHLWPAVKIFLSAGAPIQKIIDRGGDTHLFLNSQALSILKNDGMWDSYSIFNRYRHYLDLGNLWADKGWKCFAHYYKPHNGKGFIPWITAISESVTYFNTARYNWKNGKREEAMFYLGAAAHIVQDMCVPHHAMGIALNGHRKFETWAINNKSQFNVDNGGLYYKIKGIGDLIKSNADTAQKYYECVHDYGSENYVMAGKEMLFLAQKTTVTLLYYFIKTVI